MVIAPAIVGSIIGAILGSVLNTTLPKLLAMIGENSDVQSISSDLRYIKAVIQDCPNSGQGRSHLLKQWIEDLRDLAYDIQDCTDSFTSLVSPPLHIEPAGRFGRATQNMTNSFTSGNFRSKFGELKKRSAEICDRYKRFNLASASNSNEEAAPAAAADLLTCMKNAEEKLLALLEISVEDNMKVITIAGFGGLGTSFLAKQFYESEDGRQFSLRAWVNVAGEKETWKVHEKILASIIQENGAATMTASSKDDGVIQSLRKYLENERYLIVIEDAKTEELRNIISAFSWDGGNGGRIIVTTTIRSEKTWCVCGKGLSLPVDNTAQFLKIGELTKSGFNFKEDCDKFTEESLKVLDSNYENLCRKVSSELLLYFCMFPCDHAVRRDPLIRRWLAEGLISTDMTAPDAAFSTLTESNIIQPIQISKNGKVKRCQTHAMMLDCISRMPEFKKFISLFCSMKPEEMSGSTFRRLSLHSNCKKLPRITNSPYDLSRVRTMAVFSTASADSTFGKYKLLRVLDLKEFVELNEDHVWNICNYLLLLKYLSLGETVGTVPKDIRKLKQLETLDMRRTEIVTVPVEVIKLPSLTHLLGKFRLREDDCKKLKVSKELLKLEKLLSNDSKLERLSGFVTHNGIGFLQLMQHMVSLRKVKIWCNCTANRSSLYDLKEGIQALIAEGIEKHNDEYRISIDFQECSTECSDLLMDSLQAQCHLTSLKLRGQLAQFPQFNGTIKEVCLSYTNVSWDDILASLNNLEGLKCLKLVENDLGHIAITKEHLKGLERICLVGVQCLHNIDISCGALPYLVSLHILSIHLDVDLSKGEVRSGIDIKRHELLDDVALHHGVDQEIKDRWQNYASCHPNRPKVLFIESGP